MKFSLPIKTVSEMNRRDHWAAKHRRVTAQRHAAKVTAEMHLLEKERASGVRLRLIPSAVRLTRIGAGTLDTDNLASAFKAIRDGIADALRINDGSSFTRWEYCQTKARRGQFGVTVEFLFEPGAPVVAVNPNPLPVQPMRRGRSLKGSGA